ncbi:MAG: DUF2200 domain-containing protein, partial [candidate division KSB1 bacterium]|nr:DUF2200 domain-containing protein [candidate division KSB1 bacterium]
MSKTNSADERIRNMRFSSVYPLYVAKIEKKGRTRDELHQVISWLTGFSEKDILKHLQENSTFETFFSQATLNPDARLITGVICGCRIEEIENPLTRQVRYLDK